MFTAANRNQMHFAMAGLQRRHAYVLLVCATACASPTEPDPGMGDETEAGATSHDGTSGESSDGSGSGDDSEPPASESSSSGAPDPTTTTESAESSSSSGSIEVECTTARVMVAPGANLNVRPSASTTEEPIGTLSNADLVDVLEEVEGEMIEDTTIWLHISTTDLDGYISKAHASCMLDECSFFDVPEAEYLTYGLHPDASDALVFLGITEDGVTQTIGNAPDSAGTHAQDGTADGYDYTTAVDLAHRERGGGIDSKCG